MQATETQIQYTSPFLNYIFFLTNKFNYLHSYNTDANIKTLQQINEAIIKKINNEKIKLIDSPVLTIMEVNSSDSSKLTITPFF